MEENRIPQPFSVKQMPRPPPCRPVNTGGCLAACFSQIIHSQRQRREFKTDNAGQKNKICATEKRPPATRRSEWIIICKKERKKSKKYRRCWNCNYLGPDCLSNERLPDETRLFPPGWRSSVIRRPEPPSYQQLLPAVIALEPVQRKTHTKRTTKIEGSGSLQINLSNSKVNVVTGGLDLCLYLFSCTLLICGEEEGRFPSVCLSLSLCRASIIIQ